jgi:membrane protein implicated in regulation of membrane protease activity
MDPTTFSTLDRIFLLAGTLGAIVVVFRAVVLFAGGDLGEDPGAGELDGQGEAGDGFQFLSVHGLSSFFMMFGLVGLALSRQSGAGAGWSLLGGVLAGLGAIWVIARLFRFALRLQSSGTIPAQAAAGCLGTVYLSIPAGGTGRVNVQIGQRWRELDATHEAGTELPTGTPIRVMRVERAVAIVQPLTFPESP